MKKRLITIAKFLLFLGLGVLLLFFAFKGVDIKKIWNDILNANFLWVFVSLICSFFGYLSRAVRWNILIEPLGHKPPLLHSFYALNVGYFANMAFPRIGEITRCGTLNSTDKIPVDALFGTVIIERIVDVLTLFLLTVIVLVAQMDLLGGFFINQVINPIMTKISISTGLIVMLGAGFVFLCLIIFLLRNKLKKFVIVKKVIATIKGVINGMKAIAKMKNKGWFFFHSIFIWTMYFLQTYLIFFSLEPTKNLSPFIGLFVLVIGGFGMTAPVQNGFGAFHWIVSLGLMLFGLTQEQGLLYATILHESQSLFIILLGSLSLLMIFVSKRKLLKSAKS